MQDIKLLMKQVSSYMEKVEVNNIKSKDKEISDLKKRIEDLEINKNQQELQTKEIIKQKDIAIQSLQDQNKLLRDLRTENIHEITKIRQKIQELQYEAKTLNNKKNLIIS